MNDQFEIVVTSFGYKNSAPPPANVVFDVRFLQNPYWVEELRPLNGTDAPVQEFVMQQELAREFLDSLVNILHKVLPCMSPKHERYVIALGCTGGQHRSATIVEALAKRLMESFPEYKVTIEHREKEYWQEVVSR